MIGPGKMQQDGLVHRCFQPNKAARTLRLSAVTPLE
jgi:hypothetical protein